MGQETSRATPETAGIDQAPPGPGHRITFLTKNVTICAFALASNQQPRPAACAGSVSPTAWELAAGRGQTPHRACYRGAAEPVRASPGRLPSAKVPNFVGQPDRGARRASRAAGQTGCARLLMGVGAVFGRAAAIAALWLYPCFARLLLGRGEGIGGELRSSPVSLSSGDRQSRGQPLAQTRGTGRYGAWPVSWLRCEPRRGVGLPCVCADGPLS